MATNLTPNFEAEKSTVRAENKGIKDRYVGQLNNNFNDYKSGLDKLIGDLPAEEARLTKQVDELFGGNKASMEIERDRGLDMLEHAQDRAEGQTQSALRDSEKNLRQSYEAASRRMGMANSSAGEHASFALTKVGAQERTKILNTAAQIYADIDMKKNEVQSIFSENLNNLQTWRAERIQNVSNQVRAIKMELQKELRVANEARGRDIANLLAQVDMQTSQAIQGIEQRATQWQMQLEQWAQERAAALAAAQTQLTSGAQQILSDNQQQVLGAADAGANQPNVRQEAAPEKTTPSFQNRGNVRDTFFRDGVAGVVDAPPGTKKKESPFASLFGGF